MREKSQLTTLCYIEKDGKYLMLHRVKKEKDVNKTSGLALEAISRKVKARRNVCSGRRRRRQA